MVKAIKLFAAGLCFFILFKSCTYHDLSDSTVENETDASLFDELNENGYTYYQNGNILSPASQSPHGSFKLRFNATALSALSNDGEIAPNGRFPNGSVIVKEVYVNSVLHILAVIKKMPTDANAGNGWLWAEYHINGDPAYSIQSKGEGCINCHSETQNRDLVRTFDLH